MCKRNIDWGPGPQPRHVLWPGIEPATFQFSVWPQPTESHQPGLSFYILNTPYITFCIKFNCNKFVLFLAYARHLTLLSYSCTLKKCNMHPGWCGSVDRAPVYEPKDRWLDSLSGHMPGLQARPWLGVCERQPIEVFLLYLCFSPSPSLWK